MMKSNKLRKKRKVLLINLIEIPSEESSELSLDDNEIFDFDEP